MGRSPAFSFLIYNETLCEAGFPYPPIKKFSLSKGYALFNFTNEFL